MGTAAGTSYLPTALGGSSTAVTAAAVVELMSSVIVERTCVCPVMCAAQTVTVNDRAEVKNLES